MTDSVSSYNARAEEFVTRYECVRAEDVHGSVLDLLPTGNDLLALDVGSGSGRDAAWLARLGFDVVAIEPAAEMRKLALAWHPSPNISWLDDRLPNLSATHRLGLSFDVILLSAVWMHVRPDERARAFRKLVTLMKPGGLLIMSLRDGPLATDRSMWPARIGEAEGFARRYGLSIVKVCTSADRLGRMSVRWTTVCLRLPDDGSGALPLLRGIILNDNKASTYKLGLLRTLSRIADTTPALAAPRPTEDIVDVPLGLVALFWIRLYLPLVSAALPQLPENRGPDRLGFAGPGFRELLASQTVAQDLRIGGRFTGDRAIALCRAIAEARSLISRMPAYYTTYPNSGRQVFEAVPARAPRPIGDLEITDEFLRAYGMISVPGTVWRALQRLGPWVEPVLVSEWARLMRSYSERMALPVGAGIAEAALAWLDPVRDTALARTIMQRRLKAGEHISCVWTGARLRAGDIDVDHCLPWSAWPCGDLWNLLPASPRVNQHLKRDRLPSAQTLSAAKEAITGWWESAWIADAALCHRFRREASAALPVAPDGNVDEVFDGLAWRRLRLRQDQQVEEWNYDR